MKSKEKKAVILSSGGIDSTTVMAMAKHENFEIYSLSFFYGQRHTFELEAAKKIAIAMNVKKHLITHINLRQIGGSALTDDIEVPKNRISLDSKIENPFLAENDINNEIPVTYVPARNTVFLSYALAYAEVLECSDIFIGVNALDYSGYPDCRPEYIKAFGEMANLALKSAVSGIIKIKIHAPLIYMTKAQIIQKGIELGVDFSLTHSCYAPSFQGLACGECDSCILRKKGFTEAKINDPTRYIMR